MENLEDYIKKQGTSTGYIFLESTRKFSDAILFELASGWRNQSFFNKIYEVLLPCTRDSQRQAARYILSERGMEYKEHSKNNKPNYKQEFKILGRQIKNVFYELFDLISGSPKF